MIWSIEDNFKDFNHTEEHTTKATESLFYV